MNCRYKLYTGLCGRYSILHWNFTLTGGGVSYFLGGD